MRLPKLLARALYMAAAGSLLAMPLSASAQSGSAPPALLKANPSNCGPADVGRYGPSGKNACDNAQLLTIGPAENQVVTIDDTGFHPAEVTIGAGGGLGDTLTFVNLGTQMHTATQIPSSPMWAMGSVGGVNINGMGQKSKVRQGTRDIFDTGGITPNPGGNIQSSIAMGAGNGVSFVSLGANGDYLYSSYPDCLAADRSPGTSFNCTPAVIHVVDNQEGTKELQKVLGPNVVKLGSGAAVGTVLRPLGDKDCAMLAPNNPVMAPGRTNACVSAIMTNQFQKAPSGSNSKPYTTDPKITIDDIYGFDPASITITVQVPITFTNKATNLLVHDVTFNKKRFSDGDPNGGLQSGGLAPGQSWTFGGFQYVSSGSPGWVSDTDVDLLPPELNGFGNVGQPNVFLGKAGVVCPPGTYTALSFDQWRGLGQPCQSAAAGQDPSVLTAGSVHDY